MADTQDDKDMQQEKVINCQCESPVYGYMDSQAIRRNNRVLRVSQIVRYCKVCHRNAPLG